MSRPLRLEFAGALYHITSRGDRREDVFEDDADRTSFLSILNKTSDICNWACHSYCLMDNHYHLLIETPKANLSRGMRQLNGVYTQTFNRAHNRVGHVFQGRYKSILIEKHSYLLGLACYIVLNPMRANMVTVAADWPWSSYLSTAGQSKRPACLDTDWLLANFAKNKAEAIERYKQFIAQGKGQPLLWSSLRKQIYLGDQQFIDNMQRLIDDEKGLSEIPSAQRKPTPDTLDYYLATSVDRNSAICKAYQSGGYTLKQLGDYFALHYQTVSWIVNHHKSKACPLVPKLKNLIFNYLQNIGNRRQVTTQ
jgi:putative transposase